MTVQKLSSALMAAIADAICEKVHGTSSEGEQVVGLGGMRAIWWFAFAISILAAVITATTVRFAKEEGKDHVGSDE